MINIKKMDLKIWVALAAMSFAACAAMLLDLKLTLDARFDAGRTRGNYIIRQNKEELRRFTLILNAMHRVNHEPEEAEPADTTPLP